MCLANLDIAIKLLMKHCISNLLLFRLVNLTQILVFSYAIRLYFIVHGQRSHLRYIPNGSRIRCCEACHSPTLCNREILSLV